MGILHLNPVKRLPISGHGPAPQVPLIPLQGDVQQPGGGRQSAVLQWAAGYRILISLGKLKIAYLVEPRGVQGPDVTRRHRRDHRRRLTKSETALKGGHCVQLSIEGTN